MATQPATQRRSWWKYPGWWAVLGGAIQGFMGYGIILYGWTPFVPVIRRETGWTAAEMGLTSSIQRFVRGPAAPLGGWVTDKWGPRLGGLITMGFMALGWFLIGGTNSLIWLVVAYGLIQAIGYNAGLYRVSYTAANRWFVRYRARAIGFIAAGSGLGGTFMVPGMAGIIAALGWRTTAYGMGVFFLIFGVLSSLLFLPRMPEHYGLLQDNETAEEREERLAGAAQLTARARRRQAGFMEDLTTMETLKTSSFWLLTLAGFGTALTAVQTTFQNQRLVDAGLSVQEAAAWYGLNFAFTLIGRAGIGVIGDWVTEKLGSQNALALCYFMRAVGVAFFAAGASIWFVIVWVVLEGTFNGAAIPLLGNVMGDYFGRQAFGLIYGLRSGITAAISGFVPVVTGWINDVTKSWTVPFGIAAGGLIIGSFFCFLARPPKKRQV